MERIGITWVRAAVMRAHWSLVVAAIGAALLSGAGAEGQPPAARADEPITVNGSPAVKNSFPTEIVFSIDAASSAGVITDAQLSYTLLPETTQNSAGAQFDKAASVHAEVHLRTSGNQLYLPPFKTVHYFWTLTDSAGNKKQTDPVDFVYADPRFSFKQISNGNLTLHYYTGSDSAAQSMLIVGRQALDKASQLDGAPLDFPVQLVLYGTQAEVAAALSHESKAVDPNILGQADPPDTVVLVAGNLQGQQNQDTVRHELTHLVNARAVQGGFQSIFPLWLDEGLAVFGQQDPGGFRDAVNQAIAQNQVVSLKTLTPGFRGSNPDLFYGEAWSIVHFLVNTNGSDKMARLLAAFKSGQTEDQAFTAAYGLNRDGIYNAWRQSVGLRAVAAASATRAAPARNAAAPNATDVGAPPNAQPTEPAAAPVSPTQARSSSSSDTAVTVALVVGGTAIFLALLTLAVLGGLLLSRRGRVLAAPLQPKRPPM